MNLIAQALLDTPIGRIAVFNDDNHVTGIDIFPGDINYQVQRATELTQDLLTRLRRYFDKGEAQFDLPVKLEGTDFQQRVWKQLCDIPTGECWTYGELAKVLGTSARAIGGACRHNPLPIVVPCHRVVAASGIGGYSGQWKNGKKIDVKDWLLKHERQFCIENMNES